MIRYETKLLYGNTPGDAWVNLSRIHKIPSEEKRDCFCSKEYLVRESQDLTDTGFITQVRTPRNNPTWAGAPEFKGIVLSFPFAFSRWCLLAPLSPELRFSLNFWLALKSIIILSYYQVFRIPESLWKKLLPSIFYLHNFLQVWSYFILNSSVVLMTYWNCTGQTRCLTSFLFSSITLCIIKHSC